MKKYFLTGLVILLPGALTLMVIFFLFDFLTEPFVDFMKETIVAIEHSIGILVPEWVVLPFARIFVFLFLCLGVFLLGAITRWLLIKNCLNLAQKILSRIPVVKTIYNVTKDVISALFSLDGKKVFKEPVLIPFPHKPMTSLGFRAGEVALECQSKTTTKLVSVFAPTSPHPISGFLLLIPEEDVKPIDMTNEEALKFLVSCGMIYSASGDPRGAI